MKRVLQFVLPLAVLGAAAFMFSRLMGSRVEPERKAREDSGVLVEVKRLETVSKNIVVEAAGAVIPAYQVDLMAEVGGRVVWKNPELTAGGLVKKGDVLVRIDPRDFKLAMAQQAAALERAQTELALESGRQRVAAEEWKMFGDEQFAASKDLALREPQRKAAELNIESARNNLEQAKLQHGKTVIKAPFDAVVRSNTTEPGRLVTPGQSLANLIDTKLFLVVVSLPLSDLAWLKIPGTNAPSLTQERIDEAWEAEDTQAAFAELSSLARITQTVGKEQIERTGIVVRMLGDLDPVGRMARLLVSVRDPLGRKRATERVEGVEGLPILLGAYVKVEIEGHQVHDVIEIPRVALREGNMVYVVSDKNTLEERPIEIAYKTEDTVLASAGLASGERLIVSAIASPVPGMDLRVVGEPDEHRGPARAELGDKNERKPPERAQ